MRWSAVVATTLAGALVLTLLLPLQHAPQALQIGAAAVTLLVGVIVGNLACPGRSVAAPLAVAAQAGCSSLVLLALLGWSDGAATFGSLLRSALAVAVLAWVMSALVQLFARQERRHASVSLVAFATLVLGLAPLWGGAIVDAVAPTGAGADILVGVSPLTYLAQAAGWDYLRYDWIYRVTPLGSLRFDYPDFWISTIAYAALAAALQVLAAGIRQSVSAGLGSAPPTAVT
jgi:hypothetical protein